MDKLDSFVEWLNNDVGGEGALPNLQHGDYGTALGTSLKRHYEDDRQKGGIRMSNLGKPAVVLALQKLGYAEPDPKGKSRLNFHIGDMYENWLEVMFQVYGIPIVASQGTVEYRGIKGHFDYVVDIDGQHVLVEAKTMSQGYSNMFQRGPNDDRGYATQLALYKHCLGDIPAVWICLNKGTTDSFLVEPEQDVLDAAIGRVNIVLERMERVESLDDVLAIDGGVFRAPPPRAEVYNREKTGRYLLPANMSYSAYKTAIYKVSQELNNRNKEVYYFDDYADTEHMKEELEFLVEAGVLVKEEAYA